VIVLFSYYIDNIVFLVYNIGLNFAFSLVFLFIYIIWDIWFIIQSGVQELLQVFVIDLMGFLLIYYGLLWLDWFFVLIKYVYIFTVCDWLFVNL